MKRLIVNADDLGRAEGIDRGIARACREGIVTSTTLMANVPGAERAAGLARGIPGLAVGVHLVITHGRPLTDPARIRSLVRADGSFLPRPSEVVGRGRLRTEEVLLEYRAQVARARELLGREPTHVDTHHFVHDDPAVFEAFVAVAREAGLAARHHTAAQRDRLRAEGIRTPDHYRRDFQFARHIDVPSLLALLGSLGDGVTEVMCHPGERDAELERTSAYARERPVELATLTDLAVRARVAALGIELATFADLRR